jgi:serine O-acetyltransferase
MLPWRSLRLAVASLRLVPQLVVLWRSRRRALILEEAQRWHGIIFQQVPGSQAACWWAFCRLMNFHPEFRNLYYYRAGRVARLFAILCPPLPTLYITTPEIGPGLYIQHGFATIISARRIGSNCWINQQVTIGYSARNESPVIGDNVVINAGAKVIGGVSIGDNSKVGANAVVVKDVPANVTVVGVPARIVRRDGQRVDEAL